MSVAEHCQIDDQAQQAEQPANCATDLVEGAADLMLSIPGGDNFEKIENIAKNLEEYGGRGAFAILGYVYLGLVDSLLTVEPDVDGFGAVSIVSDTVYDVLHRFVLHRLAKKAEAAPQN